MLGCGADKANETRSDEIETQATTSVGVKDVEKAKPAAQAEPKALPDSASEMEVKFYYQPDNTGTKTENERLYLEDEKLRIQEADNTAVTNRVKRDATPEEIVRAEC